LKDGSAENQNGEKTSEKKNLNHQKIPREIMPGEKESGNGKSAKKS